MRYLWLLLLLAIPIRGEAVPPLPEIYKLGSSVLYLFSGVVTVLVVYLTSLKRYFGKIYSKIYLVIMVLFFVAVSSVVYAWDKYSHIDDPLFVNKDYEKKKEKDKTYRQAMITLDELNEISANNQKRIKDNNNRINAVELKEWIEGGEDFLLVDVRTADRYELGHLGMAISYTNEVDRRVLYNELRNNSSKKVVVHCETTIFSSEKVFDLSKTYPNIYHLNDWPILPRYWEGELLDTGEKYNYKPEIVTTAKIEELDKNRNNIIVNFVNNELPRLNMEVINVSLDEGVSMLDLFEQLVGSGEAREGFIMRGCGSHSLSCEAIYYYFLKFFDVAVYEWVE